MILEYHLCRLSNKSRNRTGGEMMNLNKELALLEAEMICKNLHKSNDVLSALAVINIYSKSDLFCLSDFKAEEIARICNYWKGENE